MGGVDVENIARSGTKNLEITLHCIAGQLILPKLATMFKTFYFFFSLKIFTDLYPPQDEGWFCFFFSDSPLKMKGMKRGD